ncbi:MAG TPA: type II secretion system protein, partial [Gemmatimonadaceae bacterium]
MRLHQFRTGRHRSLQRGFTLAETLVALVMAALMITLALPRIDMSRYRADAIARIVRTTLQNASRTSITRQHDMIVAFDTLGDRIRITWDLNNDGVAGPNER